MRTLLLLLLLLVAVAALAVVPTAAQEQAQQQLQVEEQPVAELWEKPYSLSIQDNSFFIEEAFNQEFRVAQHITSLTRFQKPDREIGYSFTQEWPLGGAKHQLSFEIQYAGAGRFDEFGDFLLNYRYQLLDKPDGVAFAPRVSVIVPTGSELLGSGNWGVEVNLPASKRLSESFVAHVNAGLAVYPDVAKTAVFDWPPYNPEVIRRTVPEYFFGASAIYLAHPNVNFMLEWVSLYSGEIGSDAEVEFASSHVVSPGVRAALNFDNLQVVPGIAVPVRLHDGVSETGIFGYLSFEHGF